MKSKIKLKFTFLSNVLLLNIIRKKKKFRNETSRELRVNECNFLYLFDVVKVMTKRGSEQRMMN